MFIRLISDQCFDFRKFWVYIFLGRHGIGIFLPGLSEILPRKSVKLAVLHFTVASTALSTSCSLSMLKRAVGRSENQERQVL